MKKLFAILMSVLMIACFMPTMAFADGENGASATGEANKSYVAQVGETQYETLQAAITAALAGETTTVEVELLADTKEDITIPAGKKVTLNLNGKTLTNSNSDTITVSYNEDPIISVIFIEQFRIVCCENKCSAIFIQSTIHKESHQCCNDFLIKMVLNFVNQEITS